MRWGGGGHKEWEGEEDISPQGMKEAGAGMSTPR